MVGRSAGFVLKLLRVALAALAVLMAATPARAQAQDTLCDPSFEDCRTPLLDLIRAETTEIDVGLWFMDDGRYANLLVQKWQAGVKVRILMDPRVFSQNPVDHQLMDQL